MRRAVAISLAGVIAIAMALVVWFRVQADRPPVAFPEAAPLAERDLAPPLSAFAGASACASCHASEFAVWRASTHGRAGGTPREAPLVAPFDGTPIRFSDATVTPERDGGALAFVVRMQGRPPQQFRVDGVVGGAHMLGGGTQGFVSRFPDGTLRFLPFDFARQEGVWFCNTATRSGAGWVPITPDMPLAACGDWPPSRILGEEPRIANCSNCHGSRVEVRFDTAAKRYATTVASFAIDCESCHGPGLAHARSPTVPMRALATLSKSASVGTCLSCHAVKSALRPGYRTGADLARFYSVALAEFGDSPLHPDGRVKTFAYQEGHLSSDCYVNGGMTCTDCHDPHSQGYRDVRGARLASPFDDRQCTSCHVSKGISPAAHGKHVAGSPGNSCVSCHMPYLQHPEIGNRIRFARSDHTIPVPRPAVDSAQGIVPACVSCHANRPVATLESDVRRLWGALKPRAPVADAVASVANFTGAGDAARALLVQGAVPLSGQMSGMGTFIEKYLAPDMQSLDRDAERRLLLLAADPDLDVRALALAALHYARGNDRRVRAELVRHLASSGDDDAPLRRRWAVVLGYLADRASSTGDEARAALIYRKALELEPTNPQLLLNHGLALAAQGDLDGAVEQYRRSLSADGAQPLVFVNLGIALEQRDAESSVEAYRRALAINPYESLAWFNLGNVLLRQQNAAAAAQMYEQAVSLDPALAPAHFYLARAYALTGRFDRAIASIDDGLRFRPGDADALALRVEIVRLREETGR